MKAILILLTGILWTALAYSQQGKQGDVIVNNANTYLNDYTYLTQNATAGDVMLHIANNGFNTNNINYQLEAGDLLLVIQMQGAELQGNVNDISWGAVIDYHNCGNYEFIEVLGVPNPSQIELACPIQNDYSAQGRTQVVRVPRINNLTINAGGVVTCPQWDGQLGGIVALEVLGNTIINAGGSIDASGLGFRGGQMDNQANYGAVDFAYQQQNRGGEKGESIGGYQNDYTGLGGRYGRGAPANGGGGGNTHNAGGGGGANAGAIENWNGLGNPDNTDPNWALAWDLEGAGFSGNVSSGGGRGGYTFSFSNQDALTLPPNSPQWNGDDRRNVGGIGGRPLNYGMGRIFLGGGGGAGDGNNGAGTDGANGGGIVLLQNYGTISGAGVVRSNGQNAPMTPPNGNDAPGGGGGGGTVILNSIGLISGISIEANGGDGGNQNINSDEAEGPGGGGGGGYIAISNGTPITSVLGGANGTTNSNALTEFIPNGATAGGDGIVANQITNNLIPIVSALDDTVCFGESTILTATLNPVMQGEFYWWDAPTGGNLIGTGNTYTTPNLTQDAVYYVSHCPGFGRDTVYVTVIDAPNIQTTTTDVLCAFGANGSAWAIDLNNTPGVSFVWSNGVQNDTVTNLVVGTYSVIATNSGGCTDSASVTISEPIIMLLNAQVISNESCVGGSASVTPNGGVGPYSYIWSDSSTTDSLATGMSAGYYFVQVTDANGCIALIDVTIGLDSAVNFTSQTQNVLCNGDATGSIIVDPEGGTLPYTFALNGVNQPDSVFGTLLAGSYLVSIVDSNGCSYSEQLNILEPAPLTAINSISTPANCGQPNGAAEVLVAGGVAPYQIVWDQIGPNGFYPDSLAGGNYSATIADSNGCTLVNNLVIPTVPDLVVNPVVVNPTCYNYNDGSIVLQFNGGVNPITSMWSTGVMNDSLMNLGDGMYTYTVEDSLGCIKTDSILLVEPAQIMADLASDSSYCNLSNGSAYISNITGGTGAYSLLWDYNGSTGATLANVPAGSYTVNVTDASGCSAQFAISVNDIGTPSVQIATTDVNCYGQNNGTATTVLNGGFGPFTFDWSTGQQISSPTDLIAGNHTLTITDINGCILVENVVINQPDPLYANSIIANPLCFGSTDGSIDLITFGGVLPYHYNWSNTAADSPSNPNIGDGNYTVEITDALGCVFQNNYTLVQPDQILVDPIVTNVSCNSGNNGSVITTVSGGTIPYSFVWSNGATQQSNTGLVAGNYTFSVSDDNGCQFDTVYQINQPDSLLANIASVNQPTCFGSANGGAVVNYIGGTAPYIVTWSNGTQGTDTLMNVVSGVYSVTVEDQNGCSYGQTFTITQPTQLIGALGYTLPEICGNQNGAAFISSSGGTPPYTYTWNPAGNGTEATDLIAGNYQTIIEDNNGCADTLDFVVNHVDGPTGIIAQQSMVSCAGGNDGTAVVTASGGTLPYNYYWIEAGVSGNFNYQLDAGTHHVVIADDNFCLDTVQVVVNENPAISISNIATTAPLCSYSYDGSIIANAEGGVLPYSYSWNNYPGITSNTIFNIAGGNYSLTIIDALGCELDTMIALQAPGTIVSDVVVDQNVWCFGGGNGQATASATGGTGAYNFTWNTIPNQNGATASNLSAGFYTVYIYDQNGCTDTNQVQIFENDPISIVMNADTTVCPNTPLVLDAIVYGGSGIGYQYAWTHDSQIVGNLPWLNTIADTTGFYGLVITDNLGCTGDADTSWVNTIEFNANDIDLIGTTDTLCEGGLASVELTSTYPGNLNIVWNPVLGTGNGPFNFDVYYDSTIIVSATNECNVTHTDSFTVWVWENPEITIMASANDQCPPMNSVLTFDLDDNSAVHSVFWNVGDTYSSDLLDYPIQIQNSGSYDVDLVITLTNGCVITYDDTFSLNALSSPISSFTVNPQNATDADMVYFYDNSINATSWNWYFGNEGYSDLEDPIVHFDEPDSIQVMQVVFNDIGCSDTSWQWVIINPTFNVYIPNAFTPDGDDYNNWFFPVITNASPEDYSFLIFNRWGELIYEGNHLEAKWDGRYRGKLVQDGVYVYKVMVRDLNNEKHEFYGHVSVLR